MAKGFKVVSEDYAVKARSQAPWSTKRSTDDNKKGKWKNKKNAGKSNRNTTDKNGRRQKLSASNKLTISFDPDDRKAFLTGFHKRRVERQKKAQVELRETERKERIAARKKHRDEIKAMIEQNKSDAKGEPSSAVFNDPADIREMDSNESKYKTDDQLVTVTTVSLGFGSDNDDNSADEDMVDDNSDNNSDPKETKKNNKATYIRPGATVKSIKSAALKKAMANSVTKEKKTNKKQSRKKQGAQPKSKKKLMKAARNKKNSGPDKATGRGSGKQVNGRQPRKGSGQRR